MRKPLAYWKMQMVRGVAELGREVANLILWVWGRIYLDVNGRYLVMCGNRENVESICMNHWAERTLHSNSYIKTWDMHTTLEHKSVQHTDLYPPVHFDSFPHWRFQGDIDLAPKIPIYINVVKVPTIALSAYFCSWSIFDVYFDILPHCM